LQSGTVVVGCGLKIRDLEVHLGPDFPFFLELLVLFLLLSGFFCFVLFGGCVWEGFKMVSRGAVSKNHDGLSTDQCIAHGNFGMMSKYDVNCSSSSSSVEKEDGFVMPSRRDTDFTAPDFDPDAFLDLVAADVGLIQRQKLHDILSRNANVEYLQRHGLNGRTDVASFKQCVPVINYQDVETDILRLVNSDTSAPILTAEPIVEFQLRCV
jgi:hypothetical protein